MKIRRLALATTTVSAAVLALALAAPGAALAAESSDKGNKGGASAEHADKASEGRDEASEQEQAQQPPPEQQGAGASASAPEPQKDSAQPAAAPQGKSNSKSETKKESAPAPAKQDQPKAKDKAPSAQSQSKADPAGNNGTIKISSLPVGDGRGNQPHPGCGFALVHYGFDAGQTADITFTHKAPTGSGETLLTRRGVPISDDAAGGGKDRDAVLTFTAADLGLTGAAPHRNGWHVKVAVDALEAPGGAKQKVFWLDCDGETATEGTDNETDTGGTDSGTDTGTGGTGTGTVTTTGEDGGASTGATEVLSGSLVRPLATSLIGTTGMTSRTETAAGVLSASAQRSPAAQAPAGSGTLPSVLPFTGAGTIAFLFGLAVLALAAGGAFLRAGSRRAVQ